MEAELFEALREEQARVRADPRLVAKPLVLIVPSHSLREHLLARCVAELGSVAGLRIDTLHGFAQGVLAHGPSPAREVQTLLPALTERAARTLARFEGRTAPRDLEPYLPAMRDLFDAGFSADHFEPALEALADLPADSRQRAREVLELARALAAELTRTGLLAPGGTLRAAVEALREHPRIHGARALWIHGFADTTGAGSELFELLVGRCGARVFFDAGSRSAFRNSPLN